MWERKKDRRGEEALQLQTNKAGIAGWFSFEENNKNGGRGENVLLCKKVSLNSERK